MVNPFEALLNKQQPAGADLMLATVDTVTNEGLTLIPDGETEATQKKYKYMTSAYAEPASGDRVVVMCLSGTYVVLGKIGSSTPASEKYVRRSGDTMTGNLTVRDASLNMDDPDITVGTRPSTNQWSKPFRIRDSAGKSLARIIGFYGSNGKCGIQIYGDQIVNGENKYNYLGLYMDDSGVASVEMNNPAAWRAALNALNKAGDTMTGDLIINDHFSRIHETGITLGTRPESTQWSHPFRVEDSAGKSIARFQGFYGSDGRAGAQLYGENYVNGANVYNVLGLYMNESGAASVYLTHPAEWRLALGLGTNGALPLTVAQGGSGQTQVTTVTTLADIATAGSNVTLTSASYCQWGKLAMIEVVGSTTANVAANSVLFTVVAGKRPAMDSSAQVWLATGFTAAIRASGVAILGGNTMNSGTGFTIMAAYLLP